MCYFHRKRLCSDQISNRGDQSEFCRFSQGGSESVCQKCSIDRCGYRADLVRKDAGTPMANASTTKIMTCLLAIESGKIQDTVTFSEHACSMPKVRLGCPTGTQFVLEDLLYSLMLESHNDTAAAIAEHVAECGSFCRFDERTGS